MKIFDLILAEEDKDGKCSHSELFFVFDGEDEQYFADNEGCWDWAFWFTKSGQFATEDYDCWCERMVCELDTLSFKRKGKLCEWVESAMGEMEERDHQIFHTYSKSRTIDVEVKCLYCGSLDNCPDQYKFDLARSEAEI